jgi:hypothetical protein
MRKWLIRCLVYLLLGGLAAGGVTCALGTNPAAVRQMVQQQLGDRFRHVAVGVDRARLRLLGGILVRELRLARTDGLDRRDFLYVPSAVVYHDKEHLLDGKLLVRKVELTRPTLRLVRERDGQLNLSGVLGPDDPNERLPLIVVRQGTIVFEDRAAGGLVVEVRDVQLTVVNDPLPVLQVEGSGHVDILGPITFRATVERSNLAADVQADLPAIPVGPDLARRTASLCPELGQVAPGLTGLASITARLRIQPDGPRPLSYDVTARLSDGRFTHPLLPLSLEKMDVRAHCVDGRVTAATLSAASGTTRLDVRVADLLLPGRKGPLPDIDQMAGEVDLAVHNLAATPAVAACLPEHLRFLPRDFSPSGAISFRYRYRKGGAGPRIKEWVVEPQGMSGAFIEFPCPLRDVWGRIRVDTSASPLLNITLDLTGTESGRPVALHGTVRGDPDACAVDLKITGQGIPLDDHIYNALPDAAKKVAAQFLPADSRRLGLAARPMGVADVVAVVRRPAGSMEYQRHYTVTFRKARVLYDHFPYPLENVSGVLDLLPDHWEFRQFRGSHRGGEIRVDGRSYQLPGPAGSPRTERVQVRIAGRDLLLDREFEQALSPGNGSQRRGLQKAWQTLRLAGRLSFAADVIDLPNQPQDIDVTVGVEGCFMRPTFFDYPLERVSASVRYARGRVHLRNFKAHHGRTQLTLQSGLIQLGREGGFTAWLEGISGRDVMPDRDLLRALPEGLRKGVEPLGLRDPLQVGTKLTIVCPAPGMPLRVWWEGGATIRNATFRTGVEVTGATGQFWCRGHHDGRQLRGLSGDLVLDRAVVLGQPLTGLHSRVEVLPDTPDVVRIRDLKASLFGGTVVGEARLDVVPVLRYDVALEALGVQLDQFGRHNLGAAARTAQLQGPARAAVHLTGEGGDLLGLKGNGRVDVPQGKMGQLPVLLDLLKAFGLRVPDRTAFEQAHLVFAIEGPQVNVQQLDLYGNAISLRGQGTCDLDGSNLNLDFTATMGRLTQLLPAGMDVIPQAISQQLFKIKMRGKLGKGTEMRFDKELVPGVSEPIKRALGS